VTEQEMDALGWKRFRYTRVDGTVLLEDRAGSYFLALVFWFSGVNKQKGDRIEELVGDRWLMRAWYSGDDSWREL